MHPVFLTYSNNYVNRECLALPRVSSESERKAKVVASCQPTEEQFPSQTELITNWIQPKSVGASNQSALLSWGPRHSATQQVQLLHWTDLISHSEDQQNTQGCEILTEYGASKSQHELQSTKTLMCLHFKQHLMMAHWGCLWVCHN